MCRYQPWLGVPPAILHYGADYKSHGVYFNKMTHVELELHTCPGFAFKMPPLDTVWSSSSKRDALCAEHLLVLNAGSHQ